jgi:Protein of unknown function (DUF2630)
MSDDKPILHRIDELVSEEHELRAKLGSPGADHSDERSRLQQVETELDRAWDLLRQRRAKREFGEDPESAQTRSADVVERYWN